MGIPSYFSYIIRNHGVIVKKLKKLNKNIDHFYLDSNSIIYDALRKIEKEYSENDKEFQEKLYHLVCQKIDEYVSIIKPRKTLFVAFDGVAPVAKLSQQRDRRYKSYLLNEIKNKFQKQPSTWDKTAITPGTSFMKYLSIFCKNYFLHKEKEYNIDKIIISCSDEVGEGEHKIFHYIRTDEKTHKHANTIVYGLDADLIMLSLNHLSIANNIYLYRETPEFIRSLNSALEPNTPYILDIPNLKKAIDKELYSHSIQSQKNTQKNHQKNHNHETKIHLSTKHQITPQQLITPKTNYKVNRFKNDSMSDYIFICFFLGNDFLPHFPSLNIRTKGIFKILAHYNHLFKNSNKTLIKDDTIHWTNVRKLVKELAHEEYDNLIEEYKIREKWSKRNYPKTTLEEKMIKLDNLPVKERSTELFIDPYTSGWEKRYYKALFNIDINDFWREKICTNYLEGLEWTFKYYKHGCIDWHWSYKYSYPPLFKDLLKYIPSWDTTFIIKNTNQPILPEIQLAYVLPRPSLKLLPATFQDILLKKQQEKYPVSCKIKWSFCKYFWESHPDLPAININTLNKLYLESGCAKKST